VIVGGTPPVNVHDGVIERIARLSRQSKDGLETGGILLGSSAGPSDPLIVRYAGEAGPKAARKPNFFLRDLSFADHFAREQNAVDGSQWIGEWHTHPDGPLTPSEADLGTYFSHLSDPALRFGVFIAIIVVPLEESWNSQLHSSWLCSADRAILKFQIAVRSEEPS